jgi:hypothetical protein
MSRPSIAEVRPVPVISQGAIAGFPQRDDRAAHDADLSEPFLSTTWAQTVAALDGAVLDGDSPSSRLKGSCFDPLNFYELDQSEEALLQSFASSCGGKSFTGLASDLLDVLNDSEERAPSFLESSTTQVQNLVSSQVLPSVMPLVEASSSFLDPKDTDIDIVMMKRLLNICDESNPEDRRRKLNSQKAAAQYECDTAAKCDARMVLTMKGTISAYIEALEYGTQRVPGFEGPVLTCEEEQRYIVRLNLLRRFLAWMEEDTAVAPVSLTAMERAKLAVQKTYANAAAALPSGDSTATPQEGDYAGSFESNPDCSGTTFMGW